MTTADARPFVLSDGTPSRMVAAAVDSVFTHPWHRPLYFWLGMAPFAGVSLLLYLLGEPFGAGVCLGLYIVLATFIAPQVGVYTAFAIQAWDPYFVDPARFIPIFGFPTPTKVLSFVLLAAYLVAPRRNKAKLTTSRFTLLIAATLTAWGVLISAFAPDKGLALRYAAQVTVLVVMMLAAVRFLHTREQVNRLMFWTIVGSVTACVAFNLLGDPTSGQRGRLGEFSNPNTTAMTLAVGMVAIPAAWGLTRHRWMWGFYAPAAALIMMTLMKTGSRAACISVVIAYALGPLLTRSRGFIKKLAAAILATSFGTGVFFAVLNARILDEKSQNRLEAIVQSTGRVGTTESRVYIWNNGLKTFLSRPLTGSGLGNAPLAMAAVLPGEARDLHSNYLAALVEGGIAGGVLFLLLLVAAGLAAWRIPKANPGVPAMILMVYVLLSSLTHTTYLTKMFWFPLGLILCLSEWAVRVARENASNSSTVPTERIS